jgi:hypothetical protein
MNLAQIRKKTLELLGDTAEGSSTFAPSGDYTNVDAAIQWSQEQAATLLGSTFYFESDLPVSAGVPPTGMPTTPGAFGSVPIPSDNIEIVRVAIGLPPYIPSTFYVSIPIASQPLRTDGVPVVFVGEVVETGGFANPVTIFAYLRSESHGEGVYVSNILVDSPYQVGDGSLWVLPNGNGGFTITCQGNDPTGIWPNGTGDNGKVMGVDSTGFGVVALFPMNGGGLTSACGVGLSNTSSVIMNGEVCDFLILNDNNINITIPDDLFGMQYPFMIEDSSGNQCQTDNNPSPSDQDVLNGYSGEGAWSISNPVVTTS